MAPSSNSSRAKNTPSMPMMPLIGGLIAIVGVAFWLGGPEVEEAAATLPSSSWSQPVTATAPVDALTGEQRQHDQSTLIVGGLVALFVAYVLVEFSGSQQSEKEDEPSVPKSSSGTGMEEERTETHARPSHSTSPTKSSPTKSDNRQMPDFDSPMKKSKASADAAEIRNKKLPDFDGPIKKKKRDP